MSKWIMLSKIWIVVIVILLNAVPITQAEGFATGTNVFDFVELYTRRASEVESRYGYDLLSSIGYYTVPSIDNPDDCMLMAPAGIITFNTSTYDIVKAEFVYANVLSDNTEMLSDGFNCVAAFSALEYSGAEDDIFGFAGPVLGEADNAIEESLKIIDLIDAALKDDQIFDRLMKGEECLFYQEDYKYYLKYVYMEHDGVAVLNEFQVIAYLE